LAASSSTINSGGSSGRGSVPRAHRTGRRPGAGPIRTTASTCAGHGRAHRYKVLVASISREASIAPVSQGTLVAPLDPEGDIHRLASGFERATTKARGWSRPWCRWSCAVAPPCRRGHATWRPRERRGVEEVEHLVLFVVSTQRTTSSMDSPPQAAAKSSGASIRVAVAYQKSPSPIDPTDPLATSVRAEATLRAPGQVRAPLSGDQPADGTPVDPDGSKHWMGPTVARWVTVCSIRSVLTLVATTGPRQSRMAGTAKPEVLWDWWGRTR